MTKIKTKNIKIFTNGRWESLLNQKIYKDGTWLVFTKNCGINKDGIWYIL